MADKKKSPIERFYDFHGVFVDDTGDQLLADCPFCGSEQKLYIDPKEGVYDCKVCSAKGNPQTFLNTVSNNDAYNADATDSDCIEFAKEIRTHRSRKAGWKKNPLPTSKELAEVFDRSGLQPHPQRDAWMLPVYAPKANTDKTFEPSPDVRLVNLRLYYADVPKPKFLSTPKIDTSRQHPWVNASFLQEEEPQVVWITEGEWDGLLLDWLLNGTEVGNHWVLATAGTTTNLALPAFARVGQTCQGGEIPLRILTDNDEAGHKISEALTKGYRTNYSAKPHAFSWPSDAPEGCDLTDAVCDPESVFREGGPSGRHASLRHSFQSLWECDAERPSAKAKHESNGHAEPEDLNPLSFDDCVDEFADCDIEITPTILDALWLAGACVVSSQNDGISLWTFLVGHAGSGKSLILESLSASEATYYQTGLNRKTMISGFNSGAGDPGVLAEITDPPKTLVVKDYTTITELPKEARNEFSALMREAFDGSINQKYANHAHRQYEGRFGFVAGVTPKIHTVQDADVGARFLKYEFRDSHTDHQKLMERVLTTSGNSVESPENVMRRRQAVKAWIDPLFISNHPEDTIRKEDQQFLAAMANWVIYGRAVVPRNRDDGVALYAPKPEAPTRIAKQLARLLDYLRLVRPDASEEECRRLVAQVAYDTAWTHKADCLGLLLNGKTHKLNRIVKAAGYPKTTVERHLRDLQALDIVSSNVGKRRHTQGRSPLEYRVAEWFEPHAEVCANYFNKA